MNSSSHLKDSLKDILVWIVCFVGLPFISCFLYLDWRYNLYIEDYWATHRQEAESLNPISISETSGTFKKADKKNAQKQLLPVSSQPPLSYYEYMGSHSLYFWIVAFTVLVCGIFPPLQSRILKKKASSIFNQLNQELESVNTHRSFLEGETLLQRHIIQRFKEFTTVIHKSMKKVEPSSQGSSPYQSNNEEKTLIKAITELAEDLSSGAYCNYTRESLNMRDLLDQVKSHLALQIQKLNLQLNITCPPNLTLEGDSLFMNLILLNVIGYPLYSMPKNGKLSVLVTQDDHFVQMEVKGTQYSLSPEGKQYLKFPREFLIENHKLQEICAQNGVQYTLESKGEEFRTTVAFPIVSAFLQERISPSFPYTLH